MIATRKQAEIEQRRVRIGILESRGEFGIASRLRDEIAELEKQSRPVAEPEPAAPVVAPEVDRQDCISLYFPTIKRKLFRAHIVSLGDFAQWDIDRFRKAGFSQNEIELIYSTLATLDMGDVIASGDVPDDVPEPNPYTVDLLDGRTIEDVDKHLDDLAKGVPRREVSFEMGSPRGWHQRAGSLLIRHNRLSAEKVAREMLAQYRHDGWLRGTYVKQTDEKWMPWAVVAQINVSEQEAANILGLVEKKKYGGFGWRNVRVLFEPIGETALQATVKKLDGKFRVVDEKGAPIKRKDGVPLDKRRGAKRAGHDSAASAREQANAINAAHRAKGRKPPTRKQNRAARSAEIAAKRAGRGGVVHPR